VEESFANYQQPEIEHEKKEELMALVKSRAQQPGMDNLPVLDL